MKKYWYFITTVICNVCGESWICKKRMYTKKPKKKDDRVSCEIEYCGCMDYWVS